MKKYICPNCSYQTESPEVADKHIKDTGHGAMFFSGE